MMWQICTPSLAINSYLILDPETHEAAIVDPTRNVDPLLQKIEETKAHVSAIIETHVHADFVSGSKELKDRLNNIPSIYCSAEGGKEWIPKYADVLVKDGQQISLGSIRLQARHTPGHTPEHLVWLIFDAKKGGKTPQKMLTGDFLFVGSIGRPDLLGETSLQTLAEQLYSSVFHFLSALPDEIEIYPAHGAGSLCGKEIGSQKSSTLGTERKNNPFLKPSSQQDWIQKVMKNMPSAPEYFKKIKKDNVRGVPLLKNLPSPIQIFTKDLISKKTTFILDIRSEEMFADKHLAGSINLPEGPLFLNWASVVIPSTHSFSILGENTSSIQEAIKSLHLIGTDQAESFIVAHKEMWESLSSLTASFPMTDPSKLWQRIEAHEPLFVIDVRSDKEWKAGHIKGAHHITLYELEKSIPNLPKDQTLAVTCGSGCRASIAASLLQRAGFSNVCNLKGGMQEWMKQNLPIKTE